MNNLYFYNQRFFWVLMLLISSGALSIAYYLQISLELKPCFLCILQRISCVFIALGSIINIIKPYKSKTKIFGLGFIYFGIASGLISSIWHMYIQLNPIKTFICGPSEDFIIKNNGFFEALPKLFKSTGQCQDIDWQFLGLSIPMMSILLFSLLLVLVLISKKCHFKK